MTETVGVKLLEEKIKLEFGLATQFIFSLLVCSFYVNGKLRMGYVRRDLLW